MAGDQALHLQWRSGCNFVIHAVAMILTFSGVLASDDEAIRFLEPGIPRHGETIVIEDEIVR
jgi:hypothetical protein